MRHGRSRQGNGKRCGSTARGGAETRPAYAAIDLGTNNCRMLVAEPHGEGFRVLDSFSRIVRLGEGLAANSHLCEAAIDRTVEALHVCARKMEDNAVLHVRGVATEACRRACNGNVFLGRVLEETGLDLQAISAEEEASLTLAGCLPLFDPTQSHALVFDIGGGSTEITWLEFTPGQSHRVLGFLSLPYGVVTVTEKFGHEKMEPDVFEGIVEAVMRDLAPFDATHGIGEAVAQGRVQMLGTSGTMTTLGGLYLDLPRYDRGRVDGLDMRVEVIRAIGTHLAGQDCDQRAKHPCIGAGRADLVVAGCAILEALTRHWPVPKLRVADRGIREGLLMAMMAENRMEARP